MKTRWLLCLLLLISVSAGGQEKSRARRRPKIGVALEGGGALGLAHLGVLQWFENHHIPVDYIAGTSMGGLVAGLYATGNSPADIFAKVQGTDWDAILRGEKRFAEISFRRKEDWRASQNSLELGLRAGFQLPAGLNSGQQLNMIFEQAALPYSYLPSFDQLPIPFRCVGTELVSGQEKVFDRGSLSEALRATMSIPGVFTPVKRPDGTVYVDGGLLKNLPTDVVREMGADIVIAVHLGTAPVTAKEIESLFDVIGRSTRLVVMANELRSLESADIRILVDVTGYDSTNYRFAGEIYQKGFDAAEATRLLDSLALEDAAWAEYKSERKAKELSQVPTPQFVRVDGPAPAVKRDLESTLAPLVGRPLDAQGQQILQDEISRITAIGRFTRIEYHMIREGDRDGLLVETQEKGFGGAKINPGFVLDGAEPNRVQFSFVGRATFLDLGGFRSEWRTDLSVGSVYRAASEYYRPLSPTSRWFVAPRAEFSSAPQPLYSKSRQLAEYRIYRSDAALDVGYSFGRSAELRIGYDVGRLRNSLQIGSAVLPGQNGRIGVTTLRYRMDRVDDPVVPRRGVEGEVAVRWFDAYPGAPHGFPEAEARIGFFQPVSENGSLFLTAAGGTTFGHNQTGLPQFSLGSPERLASYGSNELLTNQYFLLRAGYLHEVFQLSPFLGKGVYLLSLYEAGKAYGVSSATRLPNDVAGGVLVQSALGPLFVGGSVGDAGHRKWFFQLGHLF